MWLKTFIFGFAWICMAHGIVEDKARYDNYRIYNVHFKTDEQVKLFQQIESLSDSYIFIGHAREKNQNLTILAAAHKIPDFTYILKSNNVAYTVSVSCLCSQLASFVVISFSILFYD